MSATFEDLRVLQISEEVADSVWKIVVQWDEFAKDVVGKQLTRAVDSIGANIAESFGRYHYGEKLQFLYYLPITNYSIHPKESSNENLRLIPRPKPRLFVLAVLPAV